MGQVGAQAMPFSRTLAGIAVHHVEYKTAMPASALGAAGHASEQPRREVSEARKTSRMRVWQWPANPADPRRRSIALKILPMVRQPGTDPFVRISRHLGLVPRAAGKRHSPKLNGTWLYHARFAVLDH
jgi:hypothetical protein